MRDGALLVAAGPGPVAAAAAARRLLDQGARALLSFGVAGGLDPALRPGTLVLATAVLRPDGGAVVVDRAWTRRLTEALARVGIAVREAPLLGADAPIVDVQAKRALYDRTGAAAVDMESAAVGIAASRAGVPFAALRAIADPAGCTVPRAALAGMGPDGQARPLAVAASLLRSPGELPALLRLAADYRTALAALRPAGRMLRRIGV